MPAEDYFLESRRASSEPRRVWSHYAYTVGFDREGIQHILINISPEIFQLLSWAGFLRCNVPPRGGRLVYSLCKKVYQ